MARRGRRRESAPVERAVRIAGPYPDPRVERRDTAPLLYCGGARYGASRMEGRETARVRSSLVALSRRPSGGCGADGEAECGGVTAAARQVRRGLVCPAPARRARAGHGAACDLRPARGGAA